MGTSLLLIHLWAPEDREPPWDGELETGGRRVRQSCRKWTWMPPPARDTRQAFDEYARRLQVMGRSGTAAAMWDFPRPLPLEDAIFGPDHPVRRSAVSFHVLSEFEHGGVYGAIQRRLSALVVTLLSFEQVAPGKQTVATLRFWGKHGDADGTKTSAENPAAILFDSAIDQHRLIAAGRRGSFRVGSREKSGRDHV